MRVCSLPSDLGAGLGPAQAFALALASAVPSRKASRAPEADPAEELPMSERSEFGQRAGSGEERRAPMRLHRIGECPAKGLFGSFLVLQKGTRTRQRAKAVQLIFRSSSAGARVSRFANNRASALFARLTFVLANVSKTVFAGRDPARLRRAGPLRFSVHEARNPNSLRSDMGCSPASRPCDARLALRLDNSRARETAAATAITTAKTTARATAEATSMASHFRAVGLLLNRRMAGHPATSIVTRSAVTSLDSRLRGNDGSERLRIGARAGCSLPAPADLEEGGNPHERGRPTPQVHA